MNNNNIETTDGKWEVGFPKNVFFRFPDAIQEDLHAQWVTKPSEGIKGLIQNWKTDLKSGFVIFLIALPLCLGIAMASNVPAMAGIIAAIVGGMIVSFFNGSYLTINGPAAGLIVIILGAVESLGNGNATAGYQSMLAAVVISGFFLILLGYFNAGKLGVFFPSSVIHGMMAAIGLIIISKQAHVLLGVKPKASEPIELFLEVPESFMNMNVIIAFIGFLSLILIITLNRFKLPIISKIPTPFLVVMIAIIFSFSLDLEHEHKITIYGHEYWLSPKYLINIPNNFLDGITFPNWSQINTLNFWVVVFTIVFVQGLESMLAAVAVDKLDPFKRYSNLNKDLRAIGIGNLVSGMLGGLPMIAEIVRSSANVDLGAKTRWSNFFHGFFMLVIIALLPDIIRKIPVTSLAALLIFTGYRLASPKNFIHSFQISKGEFLVFVSTTFITLATDLLLGVFAGVILNILVNLWESHVPIRELFSSKFVVEQNPNSKSIYLIRLPKALVFTNYMFFKSQIDKIPHHSVIILDFGNTKIIDHNSVENLTQLKNDLKTEHKIIQFLNHENLVSRLSPNEKTKK